MSPKLVSHCVLPKTSLFCDGANVQCLGRHAARVNENEDRDKCPDAATNTPS